MKFKLVSLELTLRRGVTTISFDDVNYFWGQMGAGKTSIARLVDYCLGADIELTPAMQSEFVSAKLSLFLERGLLCLDRVRDAEKIVATWGAGDDAHMVVVPAKDGDGEVINGTSVENLSDLIFWLSDLIPPRVRKSKLKAETATKRLSLRNLLWYCYLDQDEIDSSFFYLGEKDHPFKKLDSRDVIRYVVGFHDEHVADLEARLDELRGERHSLTVSITALAQALKEVGVDSENQIQAKVSDLQARAHSIAIELEALRGQSADSHTTHAAQALRAEARDLAFALARVEQSIDDVGVVIERDRRHLYEIETLSVKFRRSISAKAVLSGIEFVSCPRCAQVLPTREAGACSVCGQTDADIPDDASQLAVIEKDAKARVAELKDILKRHEETVESAKRERDEILARKNRIERQRNEAEQAFDSAYLSTALMKEHERAAILQNAGTLLSMVRLPQMLERQREQVSEIVAKEHRLRAELKEARARAESDDSKIDELRDLFLDCLLRSGVPGITASDQVEIPKDTFFAVVQGVGEVEPTITSFATLSSGGKKTLFKCCFAIALHRLARRVGASLPAVLIIDSPMKNISERENREQFEGFYRLLYELAEGEFRDTQLILIDKEFSPPPADTQLKLMTRHMRPNDSDCPPLIPYYAGK